MDKTEQVDNKTESLSPAEERVKAYLEEQIKTDEALKTLYVPSKIKECYAYITAEARKVANSASYFADDAEVWKWARDFFIEELPKKAEKPIQLEEVKEAAKETVQQIEKEAGADDVVRDEYGFEVFGEKVAPFHQVAEGEDELVHTECDGTSITVSGEPLPEKEKEDDEIVYDENGEALLFGF